MIIAINNRNTGFHPYWIEYCLENRIKHKLVDCTKNDIIHEINDCDALMWHHNQAGVKDIVFARQLLFALEQAGKVVFPDIRTAWHFDDKVGQKYLLEAAGADLVPSYVFYDKQEANDWIETAAFPKVFKLRGGAGSANVRLVKDKGSARKLVRKAFGSGFSQYEALSNLKERFRKFRMGQGSIPDVAKGAVRIIRPPEYSRIKGRDRGYIYFQDFIPENTHDVRVIVIDGKAFAIKRLIRDNDFRASGSGNVLYEKHHFDESVVRMSFDLARKLESKCLAIDFVFEYGRPMIVEISYGFIKEVYDPCTGYWDENMNWNDGPIDACGWMVESVIAEIKNRKVRPRIHKSQRSGDR